MTIVFIAGSMNIRRLDGKVQERIDRIPSSDFDVVIGDADGAFKTVSDVERLEDMLQCMSDAARLKAEQKIQLRARLDALRHRQSSLSI